MTLIIDLNDQCFEAIFDHLNLHDVLSLSKTCEYFRKYSGDYLKQNYRSMNISIQRGDNKIGNTHAKHLSEFWSIIIINDMSLKSLELLSKCHNLKSLCIKSELNIHCRIESLRHILKNLSSIHIPCTQGTFRYMFSLILRYCLNLKKLSVLKIPNNPFESPWPWRKCSGDAMYEYGTTNDWLVRTYPTVEIFEWVRIHYLRNNDLGTFFELNPQIKTFVTDMGSLGLNKHIFSSLKINLHTFVLKISYFGYQEDFFTLMEIFIANKMFSRLQLFDLDCFQPAKSMNKMTQFLVKHNEIIEKLYGISFAIECSFPNLTMLSIIKWELPDDFIRKVSPEIFPNLIHMRFRFVGGESIYPFIEKLPKLRSILLLRFHFSKNDCLNLRRINNSRELLEDPAYLIIYTNEDYLLQRRCQQLPIKSKFVELKRSYSFPIEEHLTSVNMKYC